MSSAGQCVSVFPCIAIPSNQKWLFSLSCCAMSSRSHYVWREGFDKFCPRSWGSRTYERTWERSTVENQVLRTFYEFKNFLD